MWIENILVDIKNNYDDHNKSAVDEILQLVQYRVTTEAKQEFERWENE